MRAAVKNINKITVDFHGQHYCKSFEIKKNQLHQQSSTMVEQVEGHE
jgi:hypothetical protein